MYTISSILFIVTYYLICIAGGHGVGPVAYVALYSKSESLELIKYILTVFSFAVLIFLFLPKITRSISSIFLFIYTLISIFYFVVISESLFITLVTSFPPLLFSMASIYFGVRGSRRVNLNNNKEDKESKRPT